MREFISLRFWPDWRSANPYQRHFNDALVSYGVCASTGVEFDLSWLRTNRRLVDIIHLHWPEGIWRRGGYVWKEWLHLARLWCYLVLARRMGYTIVWTIHNLGDHEMVTKSDQVGYRLLMRYSHILITHSRHAGNEIRAKIGPSTSLVVMSHGNFSGAYPQPRPRVTVIKEFGLDPDRPIVACLGNIRTYKGVDIAVDAVARLGAKVQLVVAGKPHEQFDLGVLESACQRFDWLHLVPRHLSAQEYADLSAVSDLILLPYRHITGSGALFSAWTFSRMAIASDLPFFAEAREQFPGAVELFEAGNAVSLGACIMRCLEIPADVRSDAADKAMRDTSWDRVIVPVAEAIAQRVTNMARTGN